MIRVNVGWPSKHLIMTSHRIPGIKASLMNEGMAHTHMYDVRQASRKSPEADD